MASEVNPDVLAQMHRIHAATNDGTFDKATINEALKLMHDFLTGAAYEGVRDPIEEAPSTHGEEEVEEADEGGGEEHAAKRKPRRKR